MGNGNLLSNHLRTIVTQDEKESSKKTEIEKVNEATLTFFLKCRAINIPVSGPMLHTKAKEIAQRLSADDFQASNGWLESFRKRQNINFCVLS